MLISAIRIVPTLGTCLMAALGLSTLGSCRPFFNRQLSTTVLATSGASRATIDQRDISLTKGALVPLGAKLATPPEASIDLMLLPGILVELAGDTEVDITKLRLERDGDESIHPMIAREAGLKLLHGKLIVVVEQAQTRSRLRVETQAGNLSFGSGRIASIETNPQITRLISVCGKIAFLPRGETVFSRIKPGFVQSWPGHGPIALSEAGPEVQQETSSVLAIEKQMRTEEKEMRAQRSARLQ
jgi:hypothetical protein